MFSFYEERATEAMHRLHQKKRIDTLRTELRLHLLEFSMGPKVYIAHAHTVCNEWCSPELLKHTSKTLEPYTIRDFLKQNNPSNLLMPSRLFLHCYMWCSVTVYREKWDVALVS